MRLKKINWQYAIGEILIVILGISIAFGLNNWAGNRKDQAIQDKYLQAMKIDLEADKNQLAKNEQILNSRVNNTNRVLKALRTPGARLDTLLRYVYELPLPVDFRPRNITYQTLINSGDFRLINDFELKSAIQEHYLNNEHILEVYERQNILVDKYMGSYFMEKMDFAGIYQGDYSSLNSPLFINIVNAMTTTYGLKVVASEEGIKSCENLITKIDGP